MSDAHIFDLLFIQKLFDFLTRHMRLLSWLFGFKSRHARTIVPFLEPCNRLGGNSKIPNSKISLQSTLPPFSVPPFLLWPSRNYENLCATWPENLKCAAGLRCWSIPPTDTTACRLMLQPMRSLR